MQRLEGTQIHTSHWQAGSLSISKQTCVAMCAHHPIMAGTSDHSREPGLDAGIG